MGRAGRRADKGFLVSPPRAGAHTGIMASDFVTPDPKAGPLRSGSMAGYPEMPAVQGICLRHDAC